MSAFDADAFDAYEVQGWAEKDAARYDDVAGRVTSQVADRLLDAVGAAPGTRLLDVATGPGYVAARAAERGADVVGVDFSERMLAFARERHSTITFRHADATALPFADRTFDGVVAAFVLLHLGRPDRAAAEAMRVVVPGGRVAFSVWDFPSRGRWLGVLLDALAEAGAAPPADIPPGPPLFEYADEAEFTALLEGAGAADVEVDSLALSLRVEDENELWDGLIEGTVRVGPLVRSQEERLQREIRARFDELLGEFRIDDGFDVPVAVKLASGRREA